MVKRRITRIVAIVLAVIMPIMTAAVTYVNAEDSQGSATTENGSSNSTRESKYDKLDINDLTGHGKEPEDISVSAGATYQEKAWYEYVTYSDHAVSSYRMNDDYRLLFYDPYTYSNAMVMDVDFDANTTQFDTMSEYTISHSKSSSISTCLESTYTTSSSTQTSGKDVYHTEVENGGYTHTKYNYDEVHKTDGTVTDTKTFGYKKYETVDLTLSETLDIHTTTGTENALPKVYVDVGSLTTAQDTFGEQWLTDSETNTTTYSDYKTTITHDYEYDIEDHTTSKTDGWEQLSARVSKTLGSSSSTSNTWSETESTTVTKTYAATHFASDGVTPLPWAIVHYKVQMPMKTCLQVKYSGEWVTISTVYCLLTTVQGTCRAWMQNGQTYYEDWGNGEPVVETEFWSKFMTVDRLIKAYENKLYPVGGEE